MKYACFSNWIEYNCVPELDGRLYYVKNEVQDKKDCLITAEEMAFAKRLNGRVNPHNVSCLSVEETDKLLHRLEALGVVRKDGLTPKCLGKGYHKTVYRFYGDEDRRLPGILNYLLLLSFIPVFVLGMYVFINVKPTSAEEIGFIEEIMHRYPLLAYYGASILAVLFGGTVHEIAHGNACRAYKGRVFEYGFRFHYMPSFYTLMKIDGLSKLEVIQVLAAGIEANLFLAGLLMIVSVFFPHLRELLEVTSIINTILACINITGMYGTDGSKIMCCLTGLDDSLLSALSIRRLFIALLRSRKQRSDSTEYVRMVAYFVLSIFQNIYLVVALLDIISIVGVFV